MADILDEDPNNEKIKKKLKALLLKLSEEAKSRAGKAKKVSERIQAFANATLDSKNELVGPDGTGGLNKQYDDKYGSASTAVLDLNKQIEEMNTLLAQLNAQYEEDVRIAATTPSYGWVTPFGTIAAAIVAGIYGDRAFKGMEKINSSKESLKQLDIDLATNANLMITIRQADIGLDNMVAKINAALPVIQKIQGIWGAMSSDLMAIVALIDSNIDKVIPMLKSLGVDAAIKAWDNVANEANDYRVNAYIQVDNSAANAA